MKLNFNGLKDGTIYNHNLHTYPNLVQNQASKFNL